jgi:CheY-like chemotaxis protein
VIGCVVRLRRAYGAEEGTFVMPADDSPADDTSKITSMLSIGMSALCHGCGTAVNPRKAIVRGWHEGAYIIAEVLPPPEGDAAIAAGEDCVLKFRRHGQTWECHTRSIDGWKDGFSEHVRFEWPDHVRRIATRKYDRIETAMPCNVVFDQGSWVKGHIRDLGAGGCRLCVKTPPDAGSTVQVSFTLPDGTTLEDVKSYIRTVTLFGNGAFLGCQFDDELNEVRQDVELYVETQLEQGRTQRGQGKRVLVLEQNPKVAAGIRRALERRGFDVATAGGLVEGFSLLRNLLPSVLMLNRASQGMDGFATCRIIRETPGFRGLPIFVYGPPDGRAEEDALAAGATGYIPFSGADRMVESFFSLGPELAEDGGEAT